MKKLFFVLIAALLLNRGNVYAQKEGTVAIYFVYFNFVKQHKTLRTTPAMAAGLTKIFMRIEDTVRLTDI